MRNTLALGRIAATGFTPTSHYTLPFCIQYRTITVDSLVCMRAMNDVGRATTLSQRIALLSCQGTVWASWIQPVSLTRLAAHALHAMQVNRSRETLHKRAALTTETKQSRQRTHYQKTLWMLLGLCRLCA